MEQQETCVCALCESLITTLEYNLKLTFSSYSKSLLIDFVKEICNDLNHYNICRNCFMLFDELDSLILKQNIIYDKLKKYLLKRKNEVTKSIEIVEHPNPIKYHFDNTNYSTEDGNKKQEDHDLQDERNYMMVQSEAVASTEKIEKGILYESSKVCNSEHAINQHLLNHNTHKQFVCEICGQEYKNKNNFKIHKDMHNGISHFTCHYCNKTFTQKVALSRHLPLHTGEKPYQCDQCGKRFTHHTSFNLHKKDHAGQKSHKCSYCSLAFSSISHLRRHTRIHTGEKRFVCSICGKKFAEKYNLSVHEKTHKTPAQTQSKQYNILTSTKL